MVTITFLVTLVGTLFLIAGIDVFMYKQSFFISIYKLFAEDQGTNEIYVDSALVVGFILALIVDFRIHKNKRSKES